MKIRFLAALVALIASATSSSARVATSYDEPDTLIADNVVIDIIEHSNYLWFATSQGVNFSKDSGRTWLLYNSSNGLVSSDISAMFSIGNRLWVGTNHNEEIGGELLSISDGISFTDDNGQTWTQIDFGPSGLDITRIFGVDQTVFDITGHIDEDRGIDWLFFTAFAGGFLASQDGGMSWRRIWASPGDSAQFVNNAQPSLRNRYFSTRVDTTHGDSLIIWAGTAGGVVQHTFAKSGQRLDSEYITDIAFSDPFTGDLSSYIYLAGDSGVTRLGNRGVASITRGTEAGLPGSFASAILDFGGRLFVGTRESIDGPSTGLAYSDDLAQSFTAQTSFTEVIGQNNTIVDFTVLQNRVYLAAQEAGLWVSNDTGASWQQVTVDPNNPATNARNNVYAVHAWENWLMMGTDSGTVFFRYDTLGNRDSGTFFVFNEGTESSTGVRVINTQEFRDTTGALDSLAIWTANVPVGPLGERVMFRSTDFGQTWLSFRPIDTTLDIDFVGDTVYRVGPDGIEINASSINPNDPQVPWESTIRDPSVPDDLVGDTVTSMAVRGSFIVFGTANGYAISFDGGDDWSIYREPDDSLRAGRSRVFETANSGLTANFIPAMAVQTVPGDLGRIWLSCRPTVGGFTSITVGVVVPLDVFGLVVHPDSLDQAVRFDYRFEPVLPDVFAWNFGFNGDTVFAATDDGLLMNVADTGLTWDTIPLVDEFGNRLVSDEASVFSAKVYADTLWVGTSEGTAVVNLSTLITEKTLQFVDSTTPRDEVYAFPTPFRYSAHSDLNFRVVVDQPTSVSIEVYDFAMNLVSRPFENARVEPGFYQSIVEDVTGGPLMSWFPETTDGERLAVGVYYFKVEFGSGEVRWGKLAIMP